MLTGHRAAKPRLQGRDEALGLAWWSVECQGMRDTMEDAGVAGPIAHAGARGFAASVFDGHAGDAAALACGQHFHKLLAEQDDVLADGERTPFAIQAAHRAMDGLLATQAVGESGCCATTLLKNGSNVYVAGLGDCRCLVMYDAECIQIGEDHEPTSYAEYARIVGAGCHVRDGRVNGEINVARALGDFQFKDPGLDAAHFAVTCVPDVFRLVDWAGVRFVVLACDGLGNGVPRADIARKLWNAVVEKRQSVPDACCELAEKAAIEAFDNVTLLVVQNTRFVRAQAPPA